MRRWVDIASLIDGFSGGPSNAGIHFSADRGEATVFHSYPALHAMTVNAARRYLESGIDAGTRVLLPFETSMECIIAFLALVRIGALVLCVKPPAPGAAPGPYVEFIERVSERHHTALILATPSIQGLALSTRGLDLPALDVSPPEALPPTAASPEAPAFVQFSSGSTSFPKGVPITQGNLLTQLELLTAFDRRRPGEPGANWLPLFHDMGLIGGLLSALYAHLDLHLWSPRQFLSDPIGWLELISKHRVQRFAIPNFGIEYLLRALARTEPASLAELRFDDLTHVFVGAEPINAKALALFIELARQQGMTAHAVQPAYGMAEAVLIAVGGRDAAPRVVRAPTGTACVSVGRPLPGFEVVIEAAPGRRAGPGEAGEVLLRGGTLAHEYFENATPLLDADGFYRTDDIGFIDDGELFILGRKGDRLKLNGESYFAHDFEQILQLVPGVRARGCVVLQCRGELYLLLEQSKPEGHEALRSRVIEALRDAMNIKLRPENVLMLQPGQVLRTSSGKLQRVEMLERLSRGQLRAWGPPAAGATSEPTRKGEPS